MQGWACSSSRLVTPGKSMLLFFLFFTKVLCSLRLNELISSLKYDGLNQQNVFENIIIESLKVNHDYYTNVTRFAALIKKMSAELEKPRQEVHNLVFFAYADYTKKLCVDSVVKHSRRTLESDDLSATISNIGFLIIEASFLAMMDIDFRIPDTYNITLLRTLKTFSQASACNIAAFTGIVQYCQSDSCFQVFSSIYFEGLMADTVSLSTFVKIPYLAETTSFDRFIKILFDLNQGGQIRKYPSLIIAKIILNGPISVKSFKILLKLLDENIASEFGNIKYEAAFLSHKISVCGLYDQFMPALHSLSNNPQLKAVLKLEETLESVNKKYQVIQNILNAKFNELQIVALIEFQKYISCNSEALKSYNELLPLESFDFISAINDKITELFALASEANENVSKNVYMRIVLALINFIPKNVQRKFTLISIDPLYDYLLEPNISEAAFAPLELSNIRTSAHSSCVKITKSTLIKYTKVFAKFNFDLIVNYDIALASIIIANTKDGPSVLERFKVAHQCSDALEWDWCYVSSLLLSQFRHLDPVYLNDWVSYCVINKLLSKSEYLLISKFIGYSQIL
jgi:hypothetical protein